MSEVSRELLIRLPVDQEVYAEQVASGDVVQDATVATEIVAFDQDRDTYQLEGAIVFAAYVQKASSGDVVHVHQRLPFLLRVPVSAQQAGVLNVKSRLAGVQLEVSGDAWLHLGGWLEVHGLNGSKGYLFRCGAQEVQEMFPVEGAGNSANDIPLQVTADVAFEPALRGEAHEETDPGVKVQSAVEAVSEARGGAEPADESTGGAEEASPSVQRDLAEFDRFLPETGPAEVTGEDGSQETADASDVSPVSASQAPVASFEFVHQADDVVFEAARDSEAPATSQEEPSVSERSEDVAEVRAETHVLGEEQEVVAADPAPKVSFFASARDEKAEVFAQQEVGVEAQVSVERAAELGQGDAARHESEAPKPQNKKLWSFVDFNAPEPRHTLRFVIVLEHETLETVAERCGCLPSELERANPWLQGQLEPGMALLVPERRVTIHKVVQLN
ncbi:hypothetical protein [Alicyclobacillus acidocaldarius]|uniref:LysM domain-containing protein n=1 Tax=Alicyclobacillus acidocaldarius subsp. acidocaldarius (strain ATCC 27009 / DSM 446 / BCRC 14685 / JCM 5260 / KCTC 1825 / NBRC 15652 / NCIMB 11725 / NRRL B-14509 / 104-IA) TaxID=521098 RepID=C8WXM5_ALIAD|nr:hypothetical protein [Alicyclobacillus acidocaldarius]ACV58846.1 hypothetical protein Aaci_1834 [Alicyclobacillus acidocaldarius subsp. acidocaldarius DSM 446]